MNEGTGFEEALAVLKRGGSAYREGWRGRFKYIIIAPPSGVMRSHLLLVYPAGTEGYPDGLGRQRNATYSKKIG